MKRFAILMILCLAIPTMGFVARIPAGSTDQYVPFVLVDSTDYHTRETGIDDVNATYAINGGTDVAMTTPTIVEADGTTMPGVYWLLVDEAGMTTLTAGDDNHTLLIHILEAASDLVTLTVDVYRPKLTEGGTATLASGIVSANTVWIDTSAAAAQNVNVVFGTDFATAYDTTNDAWLVRHAGTLATLDALDTAQDTQHSTTQSAVATAQADLDIVTGADGAVLLSGTQASIDAIETDTSAFDTDGEYASAIWGALTASYAAANTFGSLAKDVNDATVAILVDTAAQDTAGEWTTLMGNGSGLTEAGGTGDQLTAVSWNASWDAEVQSEVDDALVAQRLDELLNADSDIDGLAPPTVGSVWHEALTKTAGSFTYDQTTDSPEAIRDHVADGTNLTEAGGTGDQLTALSTQASVDTIDGIVDAILVDTAAYDTDAEYAAAIWGAATASYEAANSFGAAIKDVNDNAVAILEDTGTTLDNLVDDLESRLGTPSDFGSGTSTISANLEDMADNGTAAYDRSTDSLQALRDRGDAAWATGSTVTDKLNPEHEIATVTSQNIFVLATGPTIDDLPNDYGMWALILDDSASDNDVSLHRITDYVGSTKTMTISGTPKFTVGTDDSLIIMTPDTAIEWLIRRAGRRSLF